VTILKNGKVIGVVCIILTVYFLGSGSGRTIDTENVRQYSSGGLTWIEIDLATSGMDYWIWDMNIWMEFKKFKSKQHKWDVGLLNAGGWDWGSGKSNNAAPPMDCVVDGKGWHFSENDHYFREDSGPANEEILKIPIDVDFLNALSLSADASCTIGPTVIPITREMVRSVDVFLGSIEQLI